MFILFCTYFYSFEKETGVLNVSGAGDMDDYSLANYSPFMNHTEIKSVVIGSGITRIGEDAFYECTNLSDLTISDTVTNIGTEAFYKCGSLTSITIPGSVIRIGESAFDGTGYYNTDGNWENNALYIGNVLIAGGRNGKYIIDNYVYSGEVEGVYAVKPGTRLIADWAFYQCKKLTGITLPAGLKGMGSGVFWGCSSLTEAVIPEGVTSIPDNCFLNCTSLQSVTIPNGVTFIGYGAFKKCSALTGVLLPDSLTALDGFVFEGCIGISSMKIPQGVTVIPQGLFSGCTGLETVDIGSAVTGIEDKAFEGCVQFRDITMPKSLTKIVIARVFTIKGYKGSYAASYASKNKIRFVALDQPTPTEKPTPTAKPKSNSNSSGKNRKEVIKGKAPKVKIKGKSGKISVTYTALKKAAGFQVRYKNGAGKWITKTFKAKTSATKTIKKLKKGRYKVQVRSFTKGKKTYSKWSKAKTVNVR